VGAKARDGAGAVGDLYQPYDDPDENVDELDYEGAELLLWDGDGDSSLRGAGGGAVEGQRGAAGAGEQQQQQMAGTAELR
jgi:hypothetical protein